MVHQSSDFPATRGLFVWRVLAGLVASHNEFGCGYCHRKGGPEELRAFYDHVRGEGVSHDGA